MYKVIIKEEGKKPVEEEIPYTVVGHTSIPTHFHIALTGKGLKEIVKKMGDDDVLRITEYAKNSDGMYPATLFEIIKY